MVFLLYFGVLKIYILEIIMGVKGKRMEFNIYFLILCIVVWGLVEMYEVRLSFIEFISFFFKEFLN